MRFLGQHYASTADDIAEQAIWVDDAKIGRDVTEVTMCQ